MSPIRFEAKLIRINSWTILRLPESASAELPSRGMTMVKGTINGFPFHVVLDPDGNRSHWFRVDKTMSDAAHATVDDTVKLEIEATKEWSEPEVPEDLHKALTSHPQANELWKKITPMARWDWIHWIRSTKQAETRKRRIEAACDKLKKGERRPCCFNRSMCTEPYVSNNGRLLEPNQQKI